MMRLVSMVPSLTETLLDCGFNVVGRTRFCIHPKEKVGSIAIVGGTKDISWDKVKEVAPDLLILDQEENPKRFADQAVCTWWSSHVQKLADVPRDLQKLYDLLQGTMSRTAESIAALEKLKQLIQTWQLVLAEAKTPLFSWQVAPGLMEWYKEPPANWQPENVLYMIWKRPWMCVSQNTFIGSMWNFMGVQLPMFTAKYPKIELEQYDPQKTLVLYSSEPYPFAKEKRDLMELGFYSGLVDGEQFSWFGSRSLRFLVSQNKSR